MRKGIDGENRIKGRPTVKRRDMMKGTEEKVDRQDINCNEKRCQYRRTMEINRISR